jgi:tetratricopeptide (TPR) repeat protein
VARLTTASMTGTGNIVGTADYMSPEQVKGSKVDGRSDVFSVGCMLYELLTGRRPFHSENLMAIFYKITHDEPNFDLIPAGAEYDALLPILQKALDKDLDERYRTAYDFAMDLRGWLQAHATTPSGEHALASLLDMEAPTHPPQPMTDPRGPTLVDGTVDLGSSATARARPPTGPGRTSATARPGSGAGTVRSGTAATGARGTPTVVDGGSIVGTRPGTGRTPAPAATVVRPPRIESRPRPAPPSSGGSPWLYVALGGLVVALVVAGGYIYVSSHKAEVAQVSPSPAVATPAAATPLPTEAPATPAPATAAPPPTFAEATGKGAVAMKAAQTAFKKGDYDKAIKSAQQALAEDVANKGAKDLVQRALEGQKAVERARRAEAALGKGDFATAGSEAAAAHELAQWDGRFTDLMNRVREMQDAGQREAQAREQREAAARELQQKQAAATRINELLAKADDAMGKSQYDAAIQLYEEAFKLDPGNNRAASGKTNAIGARAVAQAASAGGLRSGGKAFVQGKTQAQSIETAAGDTPSGFDPTAGVTVHRGSAPAELPGKIQFEAKPEAVKAGDSYSIGIYLINEGAGPISVKSMAISIVRNGGKAGGSVAPQTKVVAPRQKALLLSTAAEMWKEDTASWQMEVTVTTAPRGEIYKNTLSWK